MHSPASARRLALGLLLGLAMSAARLPAADEIEAVQLRFAGSDLHLLVAGPQTGRTVLLLHGARFNAETWREVGTIGTLAAAGYRVIALDLPGYGGSSASDAAPEDFLAALLPLVSGHPVVVVSPSMSGNWSLPLVARRPSRVAAFVALAPVGIERWWRELAEHGAERQLPALLLWGADDTVVPPSAAERLATALPHSRTVILPDAGHPVYLDQPAAFHRELLDFLAELPAP